MRSVRWTPGVNLIEMECSECAEKFDHRADRFVVTCPKCGETDHLSLMRQRILKNDFGSTKERKG